MNNNKTLPVRRRAARTFTSVFLGLCIIFLLWLATGPDDDDDGGGGRTSTANGKGEDVVVSGATTHDDLLTGVPDDFLHHVGGEGTHAKRHRHHHHHGGGYLGKVREVAEDAFDSAEETFRHFVMDVSGKHHHHSHSHRDDDAEELDETDIHESRQPGGSEVVGVVVGEEERSKHAGIADTPSESEAVEAAEKRMMAAVDELKRKVETLEGTIEIERERERKGWEVWGAGDPSVVSIINTNGNF